jgi:SAM-dependent methyltransferase
MLYLSTRHVLLYLGESVIAAILLKVVLGASIWVLLLAAVTKVSGLLGDVMQVLCGTQNASQEVVVAFDFIVHFTKPELTTVIDEVHRVLKPGGRWIIHVSNGESPFGSRIFFGDFTHELAFTRQSLAQVLLSSGFTQVSCYEDRPVPHGFKSLGRSVLWTVIRASLLFYLAVKTGSFDRKAIFSQNLLAVAVRGA